MWNKLDGEIGMKYIVILTILTLEGIKGIQGGTGQPGEMVYIRGRWFINNVKTYIYVVTYILVIFKLKLNKMFFPFQRTANQNGSKLRVSILQ